MEPEYLKLMLLTVTITEADGDTKSLSRYVPRVEYNDSDDRRIYALALADRLISTAIDEKFVITGPVKVDWAEVD